MKWLKWHTPMVNYKEANEAAQRRRTVHNLTVSLLLAMLVVILTYSLFII